jgi:serine phosphatase RsbU (regulator of sigma subunit)
VWLYAGIFCMFGALGMLIAMLQPGGGSWSLGLVMAVFAGVVALGWSFAFTTRRYWLIVPLVLVPFFLPGSIFPPLARAGAFAPGMEFSPTTRLAILAVLIAVGVSAGFTMIVQHIRRSERDSARSAAELGVAKRVHDSLVPPLRVDAPLALILGESRPSAEMGGDLIDAIERRTPEGPEVDLYLADVSGHGVGAGIVMGMVKSSIRTLLRQRRGLDEVTTELNAVLVELTRPDMFATFACLRVRPGGVVEYALAGHLPIWVWRSRQRRLEELPNQHLPLGIDPDHRFAAGSVSLEPGDTAAILTDGLLEVMDSGGRQLGLQALRRVFSDAASGDAAAIPRALFAAAAAHGKQTDDQSIAVVRIR